MPNKKPFKTIYDRIVAKRRVRLVLIVVCNKLLKQAFAIAKEDIPYDGKHVSILKKR